MPDFLPRRFEFSHGLCIFLHNEMVALAKGMELGRHLSFALPQDPNRPQLPGPLKGEELWDWLESNGYQDVVAKLYAYSIFPALLADFCPFVLEALNCSRKQKLTVTHALLRKPLRENLFYLECLLSDPDDFISRFHNQPITELALDEHLRRGSARTIVANAVARTPLPELYDPELIYDLRYRRDFSDGFAGLFNQAIHLITTNRQIQTDARNLNFIFSTDDSHGSQWQHLYTRLPYLLSYALDLCLVFASAIIKYPLPHLREMLAHRSLAITLWLDDCQKLKTGRATSRNANMFLRVHNMTCRDCGTRITGKRSLRHLYLAHALICSNCGARLPLGSLLPGAN